MTLRAPLAIATLITICCALILSQVFYTHDRK